MCRLPIINWTTNRSITDMKTNLRKPRLHALLSLGTLILLAACGQPAAEKKQDAQEPRIKVGVILPLTGELASYGEPMKVGMEMAKIELDSAAKQGRGPSFNLLYIDSQADAKLGVSAAQKLISVDGSKYIIGDVSSSVTQAIVPIAEQNKVFLLSPGASSPALENISPYFARNYPSSVSESAAAARFAKDNLHALSALVIYVNAEYGIGLEKKFREVFSTLGGTLLESIPYEFERTDFRNVILKLKGAKTDVIYLAGNQREMGNFMKQYREAGLKTPIVSNISFLQPDCLQLAGSAAEGVLVPVADYNPKDPSQTSAYAFAQAYQRKYGTEVSLPFAVGYDAVMLLANGISTSGNDPTKVATHIRDLKNYDGALGVLNFTNGEVDMPIVIRTIKNGEVVDYVKGS